MAAEARARWVYIAGDVRSGSTLLADLLAQPLRAFNAGELGRLWACHERGQLCTCGQPIDECDLWMEVIQRVQEEVGVREYRELSKLAYGRLSHPKMVRSRRLTPPASQELVLREVTERAVEAVTGAAVVIDATKMARTLWVAAHLDRPLTAVHLVRDPRAVAFACMSNSLRDPSQRDRRLGKEPVPRSTVGWTVRNLACRRVLRSRPSVEAYQVRYEDLASQPGAEIERIVGQTMETIDAFASVASGDCHSLGGNPRRFAPSEVKLDDRWRTGMAPGWKALSTVLSAPWLKGFGYRLLPGDEWASGARKTTEIEKDDHRPNNAA
jgi:hypothetical protein